MAANMVIEHHYPQAGEFLREHGPHVVAVLEDLLFHAELVDGSTVVQASSREVAARLGFLSKDSANRRIRQLQRVGVLRLAPGLTPSFTAPTYVVRLAGTGIAIARPTNHRKRATAASSCASEPSTLFPLPEALT